MLTSRQRALKILWANLIQIKFMAMIWSLLTWLTLSWRGPLSYRNQSIDLLCKSMDTGFYMITASAMKEIKLCDEFICKHLDILCKSCLTQGMFPSEWIKAIVVPIHKNTTNSVLKATDLSLFSKFVGKFSNVLFMIRCSHIF